MPRGSGPAAPMSQSAALAAALAEVLPEPPPPRLGVAVSGGGDSIALTALVADWAAALATPIALHAVTVDHGLRPDSAAEAAAAKRFCHDLGLTHDTLGWREAGGRPDGNLQDMARRARQELIASWARERGIVHVLLGHTQDDQAETVLLRLARGSGVDGLSAMASQRVALGITWLRPLLTQSRAALRDFLGERGVAWSEDPSNADRRFDRVKMREALAVLAPLGIEAAGLARTAQRLDRARAALASAALELARRITRVEAGDVLIAREGLFDAPDDLRDRVLAQALRWVASADYRPRHAALMRLMGNLRAGQGATLHGCRVIPEAGQLRVLRELRAVRDLQVSPGELWDGRWRLIAPYDKDLRVRVAAGARVRALGEAGLAACPQWRASGLPRASLMAGPALWQGEHLIAAPLAGHAEGWRAELAPPGGAFLDGFLSR